MKDVGLITGASSGIGRALAHEHARRGRDLVVVARRKAELEELAVELRDRYGVEVMVVASDLTLPDARSDLFQRLEREGIAIDYLFNNAGFGGNSEFAEQDWSDISGMIKLNVLALTELMHLFLPGMIARGHGKILNTSSTAAFIPGPLQAVYFATKAFVNSLTKGVAGELGGTGVTVTSLCPGAVKTEFAESAGMKDSKLFANAATPQTTAAQGYTAMEAGRLEVITEVGLNLAIKGLIPFIPDRLVMKAIKKIQS